MKLGVKEMKKAYKQVKIDQIEVRCKLVSARMCTGSKRIKMNAYVMGKITEEGSNLGPAIY